MVQPAETVRQWSRRYPQEWDAALQAAQQQAVVQSGNEAVGVLRRLMSPKDERIRHQAAWRLIYQRIEMRGSPSRSRRRSRSSPRRRFSRRAPLGWSHQ